MSVLTVPSAIRLSPVPAAPRRKRWTVAEFHQLQALPCYENRKMILVAGEIIDLPNPNAPHDQGVGLTEEALRTAFGRGFWVRGQMALILNQTTDPVPDVAIVAGSPRDYDVQPTTALLVVEVSDSTLAYDRTTKASLYAAGGIQDFWIVDLVHRQLIVHRDPVADATQPFGFGYANVLILDVAATVQPLAVPTASMRVADLLP